MRISDWSSDVCSSDLTGGWSPSGLQCAPSAFCPCLKLNAQMMSVRVPLSLERGRSRAENWIRLQKYAEGLAVEAHTRMRGPQRQPTLPERPARPQRSATWVPMRSAQQHQIGKASWRERVGQYVWISVVARSLKKI